MARSSSIPHGRGEAATRNEVVCLCLHGCLLRNEARGEIAPQCHDQLACQCDDGDAFGALAGVGGAAAEPAADRDVRLMAKPEPGDFDRLVACPPIAGLADALLAVDAPARPGTRRNSSIAGDLAPAADVI